MEEDILEIEIMEDGTIKTTSGKISTPNHKTADEFFRFIAEYSGGNVQRSRRRSSIHTHHHTQDQKQKS